MDNKSRITSILKASSLDSSITGISSFDLSELIIDRDVEFDLPSNLRLGHLAEKVLAALIKSSTNYKLLYENVQIIENKKTIGEIDFILEEIKTKQLLHLELAYKFYLFDPSISSEPINNWIGPNRNDSLKQKLEKLKSKQFPLLYHKHAESKFKDIQIDNVSQVLCLLVSLYIPFEYKSSFSPTYEKAIKGYYIDFETFISNDNSAKTYYLPPKTEWGMPPSENKTWTNLKRIESHLKTNMKEKQAPLCWQKDKDQYSEFFIIWW